MVNRKLLLVSTILVIIIVSIIYLGTIYLSVTSITYDVGNITVTPEIERVQLLPTPVYTGYLEVNIPLSINNAGLYDIKDLNIDISILTTNWEYSSSLNGEQVGNGYNVMGDILNKQIWNEKISVNITKFIPNFAVEDCTIVIYVNIKLIYNPIISIPINFSPEPSEITYVAPF